MAKIIREHKGEVIKNIGDALMFRFSNVDTSHDEVAIEKYSRMLFVNARQSCKIR